MAGFSKILTSAGIGSALPWPISWFGLLPPFLNRNQVSFQALDSNDRVWNFTCSVRTRGPYLKPVLLRSSWLLFVEEKGLVVNDLVSFYYDPDHPIHFRIRISKHETIRLMGHDIVGYGPEE